MNINSISNKSEIIDKTIAIFEVFLSSELKLDPHLPNVLFEINGFQILRRDRNGFGGSLIFQLNENILCNLLNNHTVDKNIEVIAIELEAATTGVL